MFVGMSWTEVRSCAPYSLFEFCCERPVPDHSLLTWTQSSLARFQPRVGMTKEVRKLCCTSLGWASQVQLVLQSRLLPGSPGMGAGVSLSSVCMAFLSKRGHFVGGGVVEQRWHVTHETLKVTSSFILRPLSLSLSSETRINGSSTPASPKPHFKRHFYVTSLAQ